MTARSLSFLNASYFQDGQPPGSIVAGRMRDFVDTLGARGGGLLGGGTFVRVTDPEFGADPTGATDSTVAFQNAMAAGPCIVPFYQPNGTTVALYRVSNCVVPNGAFLIGEVGGPPYSGSGGVYKGFGSTAGGAMVPPMIAPLNSSTTRLFNVNGKYGITFSNLLIDCSNVSGFTAGATGQICDAISAGCGNLNLDTVSIYYAKNGVGGTVGTQAYTWIGNFRNCMFMNCVNGLGECLDCHITDCWMTGCQNGINWTGNSSSNTLTDCRFEWCGNTAGGGITWSSAGQGALCNGTGENQFIGCFFDANGQCGINIVGVTWMYMSGCYFRANGANVSSGTTLNTNSSHIIFNGAFMVMITGCATRLGNVNSNSVYAPAAIANFVGTAGSNGGIGFVGNDLSGFTGSTAGGTNPGALSNSNTLWRSGTPPTATGTGGFMVQRNFGTGTAAQDVDTR